MSVQCKKIKYHKFRYFTGKGYGGLKEGLYFYNRFEKVEKCDRISEVEVLALTEWLNRYCAQHIHNKNSTSFAEARAKARATVKAIEILESHVTKDLK